MCLGSEERDYSKKKTLLGESMSEVHRRLGYWLELFFDQNQPTVDRLFLVYQVAVVAVLIEVILWTIKIAT